MQAPPGEPAPAVDERTEEERRDHYERYDDRGRYEGPRPLGYDDHMWKGRDGRDYCRRSNGTTGLIVGGMAGGVLGNIIAPGGWKTVGTIIGAGSGALIGRAIDDGDMVCR